MVFFDRFGKKKPPLDVAPQDARPLAADVTRLCFVLCESPAPGDLSRASSVVARVLGASCSAEVTGEDVVTVKRGEGVVGILAHIPSPVPGGEAQHGASANVLWPDGKEESARHRSHVIVTNFGAEEQSPIQSAITVSHLALIALDLFDGLGVYWGSANVSNSRAVFEDFCENISEEHLPVSVWLRFQFVRASNRELGLYTLGMRQFGLMDIEVDRCTLEVGDLFEFVANLAHYLIQSGPVVADGNTVGGSESERIIVRHRPSMFDKERTVYKVVF